MYLPIHSFIDSFINSFYLSNIVCYVWSVVLFLFVFTICFSDSCLVRTHFNFKYCVCLLLYLFPSVCQSFLWSSIIAPVVLYPSPRLPVIFTGFLVATTPFLLVSICLSVVCARFYSFHVSVISTNEMGAVILGFRGFTWYLGSLLIGFICSFY